MSQDIPQLPFALLYVEISTCKAPGAMSPRKEFGRRSRECRNSGECVPNEPARDPQPGRAVLVTALLHVPAVCQEAVARAGWPLTD